MVIAILPTLVVECDGVKTVREFWQRYLDAVQPVEEGFGCNLDAFWDAIGHGGPGCPAPCRLVFRGTDSLKQFRSRGGRSFLTALRDIANDATHIEVILS